MDNFSTILISKKQKYHDPNTTINALKKEMITKADNGESSLLVCLNNSMSKLYTEIKNNINETQTWCKDNKIDFQNLDSRTDPLGATYYNFDIKIDVFEEIGTKYNYCYNFSWKSEDE